MLVKLLHRAHIFANVPTKVVEDVRVPLGDRHSNNQHDHGES